MSMCTSPHSETMTILLWGDRWWISGQDEPVRFGELSSAASVLLEHIGPTESCRRVRLIYQPTLLMNFAVRCPRGSRSTVKAALQEEYPQIADPNCAWGFEPVFDCRTLLHFEGEPFLFALIAELNSGGIEIEGVWPLATVLNLVPEDWPDNGALTAIAVADGLAMVFRHTPVGEREIRSAEGEPSALLVASTLRHAVEREDAALYVVALDGKGSGLAAQVGRLEKPGRTDLTWEALCRAAATLSLTQPNQLLPRAGRIGAGTVVVGVAAVAMVSAVVVGIRVANEIREERQASLQSQGEFTRLLAEVDHLHHNETEARSLQAEIELNRGEHPRHSVLLQSLAQRLPPQVVLTSIITDEAGFEVAGGVSATGLGSEDWRAWLQHLDAPGSPWRLAATTVPPPAADFTLKGAWR